MQIDLENYFLPVSTSSREVKMVSKNPLTAVNKKLFTEATTMEEVKFKNFLVNFETRTDEKLSKEDLSSLAKTVEKVSEENRLLTCELESAHKQYRALLKKIVNLVDRGRRNNLIFRGLDNNTSNYGIYSKS